MQILAAKLSNQKYPAIVSSTVTAFHKMKLDDSTNRNLGSVTLKIRSQHISRPTCIETNGAVISGIASWFLLYSILINIYNQITDSSLHVFLWSVNKLVLRYSILLEPLLTENYALKFTIIWVYC